MYIYIYMYLSLSPPIMVIQIKFFSSNHFFGEIKFSNSILGEALSFETLLQRLAEALHHVGRLHLVHASQEGLGLNNIVWRYTFEVFHTMATLN